MRSQVYPIKVRSMVGLIPLFAVEVFDEHDLHNFPDFIARTDWFLDNRPDLARRMTVMIDRASDDGEVPALFLLSFSDADSCSSSSFLFSLFIFSQPYLDTHICVRNQQFPTISPLMLSFIAHAFSLHIPQARLCRLMALPSRDRLERILVRLFDEDEFLSPFGVRSLSKVYTNPYVIKLGDQEYRIQCVTIDFSIDGNVCVGLLLMQCLCTPWSSHHSCPVVPIHTLGTLPTPLRVHTLRFITHAASFRIMSA